MKACETTPTYFVSLRTGKRLVSQARPEFREVFNLQLGMTLSTTALLRSRSL